MVDQLLEYLKDKRLLILGFGMEGQSTYHFIRNHLPAIPLVIADRDPNLADRVILKKPDKLLSLIAGEDYCSNLHTFDVVIKSPGIALKANADHTVITSQTDLVMRLFRKQVIGITGTKGKSTTSSLLYHILQLAGKEAVLVGNIGIPPFDLIGQWDKKITIVYEISSHQLEYLTRSPHISILLNLYQEHLDHYPSFDAYQSAKLSILKFQEPDDHFIFNQDDMRIVSQMETMTLHSRSYSFSATRRPGQGCFLLPEGLIEHRENGTTTHFPTNNVPLKGEHNRMNIMAVICACKILKVANEHIQRGLETFSGLAHRLEYIGSYHGIHFYNDSIATVPEATMHAVKTLKSVDTLILGGFDRGIDYAELVAFLVNSEISNFIFTGEAGERIKRMFPSETGNVKRLLSAKDFPEVMYYAKKHTQRNMICLLSPAAASYGMFRDFKERGNVFRELARNG